MAVELATGYVSIVPDTSRVREELRRAFGQAGDAAGQAGGDAAGGAMADALGKGGKGGPIAAAVTGVLALAGAGAAAAFAKTFMSGLESQQNSDLTQARLGVDDATMKKIGFAAGRSYVDAFGASASENMDTARRAIQSGLLDPNATAQEISAVINQLSGISEMMGEEIPAVARAAGQAIRTGMAGSAAEAFDLFAAAERNGLNVSEDFLDTITEYGTQFRKLGLSGQEAVGLINQAVKAGARDTDIAADAMKEFSIRVVDGSESTTEAFENLGLNAENMAGRFVNGGGEAREAMQELFAALAKVEDPVKANEIALGLFGTQLEDLGEAFQSFNLDTAAESLGKVSGAAQDALAVMGGNAATSVESAKRSIEQSLNTVSGAMANAFGPGLAKLADWVSTHEPEILGFMGKVADAAFAGADAFLSFSAMSLRALATFTEGAGSALSAVLDPLGKVAEIFGGLTRNEDLADLGRSVQDLDDKFLNTAEGARILADGIDNTVRPGLDRMRQSVAENIGEAVRAQEVMRALGDTVTALPDGHEIILQDNSPEVTARLEALGLKVTTLPSGEVRVSANTQEGQALLDAFISRNSGKVIPVEIAASLSAESRRLAEAAANSANQTYSQGYVHYANGGIREPGIGQGNNAIVWNEAGPEAYIPLGSDKRDRSVPLWWEVGRRLGLLTMMANGGIAGQRATSYARSHAGEPYVYGALDCSGYMSGIYNALTGKSVRFTTASDFTQFGFRPGLDPAGFSIGTDGGIGVNGHMAGTLLGTNVESDGSNGIQFGGSADGAAAFPRTYYLPREMWSPPETDDPSKQSGGGGLGGPSGGGLGGGVGGAGVPGGGVGAGNGGASGGTYGGQQIPPGVTPVWVVNSAGGAQPLEAVPPDAGTPSAPAAPAAAPAQGEDFGARALDAGRSFIDANVDSLLGDLGLRRQGGAIQALTKAIFDIVTRETAAALAEQQRRQAAGAGRYMGRV